MTIQQILTNLAKTGSVQETSEALHLTAEEVAAKLRALAESLPSETSVPLHETAQYQGWVERGGIVGVDFNLKEEIDGNNIIEVSSNLLPKSTLEEFVTRMRKELGVKDGQIKIIE